MAGCSNGQGLFMDIQVDVIIVIQDQSNTPCFKKDDCEWVGTDGGCLGHPRSHHYKWSKCFLGSRGPRPHLCMVFLCRWFIPALQRVQLIPGFYFQNCQLGLSLCWHNLGPPSQLWSRSSSFASQPPAICQCHPSCQCTTQGCLGIYRLHHPMD